MKKTESMSVDLAFFDGDNLLCRTNIRIEDRQKKKTIESPAGHVFRIDYEFEYPGCPISIVCEQHGKSLYKGALVMGVHESDDWESINLGNVHDLGFWCRLG